MALKKRTGIKIFLISFGMVLIILGSVAGIFYHDVSATAKKVYTPVKSKNYSSNLNTLKKNGSFKILLLGIDSQEGEGGSERRAENMHADTVFVAKVNPESSRTDIISLPKESIVSIPGESIKSDKLCNSYSYGGVTSTIETIQPLLNTKIDYYMSLDWIGLEKLVDQCKGIDINNPITTNYNDHTFVTGELHLDGKATYDYLRGIFLTASNETIRQEAQARVLSAIFTKLATAKNISSYPEYLNLVENNVETDLSFKDCMTIGLNDTKALKNVSFKNIQELTPTEINEAHNILEK